MAGGEEAGASAPRDEGSIEGGADAAYHLHVDREEVKFASSALRLLISDEAHEPAIRALARAVLDGLAAEPGTGGLVVVALNPQQMKIAHTAVKLLHDDLGREQADERRVLARVLDKLPDEHAIRAILID
jgi:hypothetical protein